MMVLANVSTLAMVLLVWVGLAGGDLPGAASDAPGGAKYDGVSPGSGAKNPLPRAKVKPVHLIWSGFQMTEQGSRVFFQVNGQVTFDGPGAATGKPAVLSVFLRNCRIHLRNNRRQLDTRFFATPVKAVSVHSRRKDVELRIVLKESVSSTPRLEAGDDGTHYVVLDFPRGTADQPQAAQDTPSEPGTSDEQPSSKGAAPVVPPSQSP